MLASRAYMRVWPASVSLATYFLDFEIQNLEKDKKYNFIELGCGTGYCSLAILEYLRKNERVGNLFTVLTDGDKEVMKVVEHNIEINFSQTSKEENGSCNLAREGKIVCQELFWGNEE